MNNIVLRTSLALGLLLSAACQEKPAPPTSDAAQVAARKAYDRQIMDWRAERVQRLTKPDGWLSLVGMHWIEFGNTRVGSAPDNGTRLDVGPAHLGILSLARDGKIHLQPDPGAGITINGQPVAGGATLQSDADLKVDPTVVGFNRGDASFIVIKRGDRYALRVRDALAPTRTGFTRIPYFDIDPAFRFKAKFTPHAPGSKIDIVNILSLTEAMDNPGTVTFQQGAKSFTLEAIDEGDHRLFLVYADRTSGHQSYPASRFLYADYPDASGYTVVDFNKGYNPPCAFTAFSTCPLPPPGNRLDLAITAGEKKPFKPGAEAAN